MARFHPALGDPRAPCQSAAHRFPAGSRGASARRDEARRLESRADRRGADRARGRPRGRPRRSASPFLRRVSPRRNLWPEVAAYDESARELSRRAATLNDEISAREEALRQALEADREALTEWQLGDQKRPRPEPTAPAIEREIEEKKADRDAANAAAERVYEHKERFVAKHRRRLIRDADKATNEARERYEKAIEEAERARAELVDSRASSVWAALFPGELANQAPDTAALVANLRKPVEAALQVTSRLAAAGVFSVLRSDAETLATALTRDQAQELGVTRPYHDAAIWTRTEEGQEALRQEGREARERFEREWGKPPSW